MPTLWEILTKKVKTEEQKIYNPLGASVGNAIKVESLEYESLIFTIYGIREVKRDISKEIFSFTDYDILAKPLDKEPVKLRLRLIPRTEQDSTSQYDVLLLKHTDELAWDDAFYDSIANQDQIELGEGYDYFRVGGLKTPWEAISTYLQDTDHSKKIEKDEVKKTNIKYFDFESLHDEKHNYYIVEMNAETGYFDIYQGELFDIQRVSIF